MATTRGMELSSHVSITRVASTDVTQSDEVVGTSSTAFEYEIGNPVTAVSMNRPGERPHWVKSADR